MVAPWLFVHPLYWANTDITSTFIVLLFTFSSSAKNAAKGFDNTGSEWYSSRIKKIAAILCAG